MENEKRLIDVNEPIAAFKRHAKRCPNATWNAFGIEEVFNVCPTVDAVEVVHGRWEKVSETMPIYRCSICKERNLYKNGNNVLSNYCPHCGAKMDLED